jgi:hypothetical protein
MQPSISILIIAILLKNERENWKKSLIAVQSNKNEITVSKCHDNKNYGLPGNKPYILEKQQ